MRLPSVLFTSGVFPPTSGGPGTILVALIPRLMGKGYRCSVITYGMDDGAHRPYPVIRIPLSTPQPFRTLLVFWKIFVHASRADILYTLDTYSPGLGTLIAHWILRKPFVLRFTGDSAWELLFNQGKISDDIVTFQKKWYGLRATLLKFRRTIILRGADRIITDCQFLKDLVGIIGIETEKVTVIHNPAGQLPEVPGFDLAEFKREKGAQGKAILSMSRLVPWKGLRIIIELMPRLLRSFPTLQLWIAGEGPDEAALKELIQKLHLEGSVRLLGVVSDKIAKHKLYLASDIVAQNTFYEGMSNTLLEAMLNGKAIVTTMAGGNPEFIDAQTGLIVEYNNKDQWETALLNLLSNPKLIAELGHRAREKAKFYTLDLLVEKNINLIESLT